MAAKAERPTADKWDGSLWDDLGGSRVVAVKPAAVCEGKESKARIPESNPPSIWCPDPPPQSYLSLTRQTLSPHRTHLLAAGCPLTEESLGM